MSKQIIKPLSIALGATFAVSMAASNIAAAAPAGDNPFAMSELESGYMQVAGKDGKCGEGKCGEGKKKEGKCGEGKKKEGKCGEGKKKECKCGEGKCGEGKKDGKKEGKCGEGKCGGK